MAALSHASVILPFWGMIASVVIWVTQKDKSAYVRFQALQAVAFHITQFLLFFVGMGCYMCSFFGNFLAIPLFAGGAESGDAPPPLFFVTFLLPFVVMGAFFLGWFLWIVYGLVAAVLALQGKDFRYFIIGNRLHSYLEAK